MNWTFKNSNKQFTQIEYAHDSYGFNSTEGEEGTYLRLFQTDLQEVIKIDFFSKECGFQGSSNLSSRQVFLTIEISDRYFHMKR